MSEVKTFEDMIAENGRFIYTNKGVSMMPLLRQRRDIIYVAAIKEPIKKYDAVVFKRLNGQYVLHRVIKIKDGIYYINGDNCIEVERVKREQIIGILERIERNGKTVLPTDFLYRAYTHLWCDFFHIRIAIIYCKRNAYAILGAAKRFLLKMKKRS